MWNDFQMKKPPYLTLPSTKSKFVVHLHAIIETYFREIGAYTENFNKAACLLSRLMARRKNSFRHMCGFKWMCKLNSALCRLLKLDFARDLNEFHYSLPDVAYEDGMEVLLPARDCFDYLLMRLFALNKLYERIIECCLETAKYFYQLISMNQFFDFNALLLAVVAKIRNFSLIYNAININLYNELYKFRCKLPVKPKGANVAIEFCELPKELACPEKVKQKAENIASYKRKEILPSIPKRFKKVDTGCVVERNGENKNRSMSTNNLKSVKDVTKFISKENNLRSKNIQNCVTKDILPHEWLGVTRLFKKRSKIRKLKLHSICLTNF